MTCFFIRTTALFVILATAGCAGQEIPHEPDAVDVALPAPAEAVTAAVIQVLTDGGYEVSEEAGPHLTTGYRREIQGPWDWLLRWRFGTGRSRVDARVTSLSEQSARLQLDVRYEGKDGIGSAWEESPTPLPQSAENELRLIRNALKLL